MFCAGDVNRGGIDACQVSHLLNLKKIVLKKQTLDEKKSNLLKCANKGDSGGPIVYTRSEEEFLYGSRPRDSNTGSSRGVSNGIPSPRDINAGNTAAYENSTAGGGRTTAWDDRSGLLQFLAGQKNHKHF